MPLYHASRRDFADGDHLVAAVPTDYYPKAATAIDKLRPTGAPSRNICLFSAEKPEFAVFFLMKQGVLPADIRLYEIDMLNPWRSPFALTHAISKKIEAGVNVDAAIAEYWSPTLSWNFFEVFGPEMIIQKQIPIPSLSELILTFKYGQDFDRASDF